MAFRASLELNNKEFDVLYSNYEFSRNTDPKGMPSSSVLGGRVKATIESTEDTSVIEAMLNSPFKPVEGKIIYKKPIPPAISRRRWPKNTASTS